MKSKKHLASAAVAAAALAVPATAGAHGSVYTDTAKVAPTPLPANATQNDLQTQTRYAVTNHGYTYVLRETNNRPGVAGMLDYKKLPSAYRTSFASDKARWLSEGGTAAQPHATCSTPELNALSAVLSWQGNDPFYGYIPWQATSAGLEDDPALWLPRINTITGKTLTATMTTDQLKAACEGIGGTFFPADTIQTTTASLNAGYAADIVAPLNTQIGQLNADKLTLQGALDTANGAKTAADAAKAKAEADLADAIAAKSAAESRIATAEAAVKAADAARVTAEKGAAASDAAATSAKADATALRLKLTRLQVAVASLPTASEMASDGMTATVNGPAGEPVTVRVLVTETRARALKLKSRVIASGTGTIGSDATGRVTVKATTAGAKALRAAKGKLGVTVQALSGDRVAQQEATL
ncbi:hypothetical protein GKE82_12670 [Conexibacter sp. W3-3-2]|uniref:hypothetical protein n=1 Tax=Conexibacter sp. W3-3-2 TaxID=2675227 RepID=UPI0012B85672|nr:hypothetical protein [Conexibacter sp. W3-3-2]MTD45122.1 hypothetical protein [Conexibacter sp. W3-3-2]